MSLFNTLKGYLVAIGSFVNNTDDSVDFDLTVGEGISLLTFVFVSAGLNLTFLLSGFSEVP